MELLARIGFYVSLALTIIGIAGAIYTYMKFNIRQVYLIKSGKAKRRSVNMLEAHNRETGKLRDDIDLDYSTGSLRPSGGMLGKTLEQAGPSAPFNRERHSGRTETFSDTQPMNMPEGQRMAVERAAQAAGKRETVLLSQDNTTASQGAVSAATAASAPETTLLSGAEAAPQMQSGPAQTWENAAETDVLAGSDSIQEAMPSAGINNAYALGDEPAARAEPRAPFNLISTDMVIHTQEVIAL